MIATAYDETGLGSAPTLTRPLTHLLACTERGLAVKATRVCSDDSCDRPAKARGMCGMHWQRWRATDPVDVASHVRSETGVCSVDGCERPHHARGVCHLHHRPLSLYGDPLHREPMGAREPARGPGNAAWKSGAITYYTAHQRVTDHRGRAAEHLCVDCGGSAVEWSYTHSGIAERVTETGMAYSTDPRQYVPRCKADHASFDAARRRAGESDEAS